MPAADIAFIDELRFNEEGLIPAIAQDWLDGAILMQADEDEDRRLTDRAREEVEKKVYLLMGEDLVSSLTNSWHRIVLFDRIIGSKKVIDGLVSNADDILVRLVFESFLQSWKSGAGFLVCFIEDYGGVETRPLFWGF